MTTEHDVQATTRILEHCEAIGQTPQLRPSARVRLERELGPAVVRTLLERLCGVPARIGRRIAS